MTTYELIAQPGNGLAVIERIAHGDSHTTLWSLGRCRKDHRCVVTGNTIHSGELAYSPLGNTAYRYERIEKQAIDHFAENL